MKNYNSWSDFQQSLITLNNKEKGNAFELLTKFYFKINPEYSFYDEVWLFDEVPTIELEHLGLPSHDLGIDLIAKKDNEYHAIQCKYHTDKNSSVTFKEVSTFISLLESNDKISQGYICSSAIATSRNLQKINLKPINLIMSDSWQMLDKEFFDNVRRILEGEKVKFISFQPRPHQEKAIKQAEKYFLEEDQSRGKLIFPCGAGKSLTGYWLTQELKSNSTIIAVPSLSLVKQTLGVYLREIAAKNKKIKWLCICSDEGIGKNDDIAIFTENLGVPCYTDPVYIEQWLKDNIDEEKIIFTTYQSGRIIAEISKKLDFKFDLGIFDEAHKTVGSKKKLFSHLLFEENISIDKRIFMTATQRFYQGSKDDIISMDDEDVYGDTFAEMSFKEAIELGLLTDYKVITIDIKKTEIAEFIRDNNLVQLNSRWKKETEARSLASMLALRKAMKRFSIKNAVSFHSSIEKAVRNKELQKHITNTYNYAPIDTYTVSGKQSTSKRNDIVNEFAKSEKALITNARCLTEGVDVPNIDCIVFADPRKSKVDIVQALGRALRKKEGKDWGYVILPVIYDDVTQEIDNDNFNEILSVVRGLASNDERIVDYFKDKNQPKNKKKKEGAEQFNFEVFSEYIDESQLSEQLQIKLWEKLSKFNWLPFEEAREYVRGLKLKNQKDWSEYLTSEFKPENIPAKPERVYNELGWKNLGDFIGTFTIATQERNYLEYYEAKKIVVALGLKNQKEWEEYCQSGKKPENIPASPHTTYKDKGWKGIGDWLGTGTVAARDKVYRPFIDARKYIRNLNLKSQNEWREYIKSGKKPEDIPSSPGGTYKDKGWINLGDWLGTMRDATRNRKYQSFKQVKEFVRSLDLKSKSEWYEFCQSGKRLENIPASPDKTYKDKGWKGWGDFFGTNRIAPQDRLFLDFENVKKYLNKYDIKNAKEWNEHLKLNLRPPNIPSNLSVYKNRGWEGWRHFRGVPKKKRKEDVFLSFEEAKRIISKFNLKGRKEWSEFCKSEHKPINIPSRPDLKYKSKGWKGLKDFLGNE